MRVLFVTFFFPPMTAVASLRTAELCRGLLRAGHDVTVVTYGGKQASGKAGHELERPTEAGAGGRLRVQRIPSWWPSLHDGPSVRNAVGWLGKACAVVNRLASRVLFFLGFDAYVPWAAAAWAAVSRDEEYDCVLVSAGPFSTLFTAYALARRRGRPVIYDYRDVWNGTPYAHWRCSTRWLERFLLARAALVVSVSPSCLTAIVGNCKVPGTVITNGIGEDVMLMATERGACHGSRLVYAGAFYPPKRSFEPIAAAMKLLKRSEAAPLLCSYLGPHNQHVREVAERYGIGELVETPGLVSRREALTAQSNSLCVVVVTSVEQSCCLSDKGIVTGKIFEAIALAPRVLVISPVGSDVRALTAHLPHVKHFHGGQVNAIADWLGGIRATPARCQPASAWQEFSWPYLAARFSSSLEQAVGVSASIDAGLAHD